MESTNIIPCLVDVRGAARMFSVSERSVWRMLRNGAFPTPVRIGRSTRWHTAELHEYASNLAREAKQIPLASDRRENQELLSSQ